MLFCVSPLLVTGMQMGARVDSFEKLAWGGSWARGLAEIVDPGARSCTRSVFLGIVAQSLTYGSVRGALGNRRPYRDNVGLNNAENAV